MKKGGLNDAPKTERPGPPPPQAPRKPKVFSEKTLRAEIAKQWGEHGAHCQMFDIVMNSLDALRWKFRVDLKELGEIIGRYKKEGVEKKK